VAKGDTQRALTEEGKRIASKEGCTCSKYRLRKTYPIIEKGEGLSPLLSHNKKLRTDKEDNYSLKIREQAHEHSFTDVAELLAVITKPGVRWE